MTWVIIIVIGAIIVGCICGASECSRREKLFLDRFPLPSDDEVKEYEKMIPLAIRVSPIIPSFWFSPRLHPPEPAEQNTRYGYNNAGHFHF